MNKGNNMTNKQPRQPYSDPQIVSNTKLINFTNIPSSPNTTKSTMIPMITPIIVKTSII